MSSIAAQYSCPAFVDRSSHASCESSLGQLAMNIARELAEVLRDLRARPPAARMTEQREVGARREADRLVHDGQLAELDEVVPAAARAELRPRPILELRGNGRDGPVPIHDVVLAWRFEGGAHPEARLALDRVREP